MIDFLKIPEKMVFDKYGDVLPVNENARLIAILLKRVCSRLITWTDGIGTHFDILLCLPYSLIGESTNIQRGIKVNDLFVSIMGLGAHAFIIGETSCPSDYDRKLGGYIMGPKTAEILASFLNEIRMRLAFAI